MSGERTLLVDASVFITLAEIGALDHLLELPGTVTVPRAVANEITEQPAAGRLESALEAGRLHILSTASVPMLKAADFLGHDLSTEDLERYGKANVEGDVALLALAMAGNDDDPETLSIPSPVVVTDDKPLRQTCRALSIPVSGSIGVLVRAVERGDLDADEARAKLQSMDEVGARLSASLFRKAERLIEDAAEE